MIPPCDGKTSNDLNKLTAPVPSSGDKPLIVDVLKERGKKYGSFETHAILSQKLKAVIRNHDYHYETKGRSFAQAEAIDMILYKIARIINGDPNYKDSWVDIEGYAHLISETLKD
jgi:hypothetical protein